MEESIWMVTFELTLRIRKIYQLKEKERKKKETWKEDIERRNNRQRYRGVKKYNVSGTQ